MNVRLTKTKNVNDCHSAFTGISTSINFTQCYLIWIINNWIQMFTEFNTNMSWDFPAPSLKLWNYNQRQNNLLITVQGMQYTCSHWYTLPGTCIFMAQYTLYLVIANMSPQYYLMICLQTHHYIKRSNSYCYIFSCKSQTVNQGRILNQGS